MALVRGGMKSGLKKVIGWILIIVGIVLIIWAILLGIRFVMYEQRYNEWRTNNTGTRKDFTDSILTPLGYTNGLAPWDVANDIGILANLQLKAT